MQLTHKFTGFALFSVLALALSGVAFSAHADDSMYSGWTGSNDRWESNGFVCEVRYDSWQNGTNGNWQNDGWQWDDQRTIWIKCVQQDTDNDNQGDHNQWKDDDHDGRCDWDGKDWDTWNRDHGKSDWNNNDWDRKDGDRHDWDNNWNKHDGNRDWDNNDNWKNDNHDWDNRDWDRKDNDSHNNDWDRNDRNGKDGRSNDGKDGRNYDDSRKSGNVSARASVFNLVNASSFVHFGH